MAENKDIKGKESMEKQGASHHVCWLLYTFTLNTKETA